MTNRWVVTKDHKEHPPRKFTAGERLKKYLCNYELKYRICLESKYKR